ncbi:MAG: hypothetical protein KDD40_06470 [Bdellovibrionales bacterium]|nr:hypothetical protein [Bdellovibrionales bacterium]
MFRFFLYTMFIMMTGLGCASLFGTKGSDDQVSEKQKVEEKENLQLFDQANKYLDAKKYDLAIKQYETILHKSPSTSFETLILFNLGTAYEGKGDCRGAGRSFRKVVKIANQNQKKLQAESLFRLALAYECIGNDEKTITTLKDLELRKEWISAEVAFAELPAKLASAYARKDNSAEANKYYKMAEKGLAQMTAMRMDPKKKQEMMARTLYSMGTIKHRYFIKKNQLKYVKNLEYVQKYLLKSVELNHSLWSPRAAESLLQAYDNIWLLLEHLETSNSSEEMTIKRKKVNLVQEAITAIELLKKLRFPETSQ